MAFLSPPEFMVNVPNGIRERCLRLSDKYKQEWGEYPTIFSRAPGRVNLIGEHIDYMGFAVLPMALENDVLIAAGTLSGTELLETVSVINLDPEYPNAEFEVGAISPHGAWHNYVACGVKGATEDMRSAVPKGIRMVIDGTIPCASGLSSSSALVCAAALAMYKILEITSGTSSVPSRLHIASICCESERYIGTMGGGMDQVLTISRAGRAQRKDE